MRLPKYAEHSFARACSAADAVPHRPDEDENGWDYIVELKGKAQQGHSDTHTAAPKAFVQIKSTVEKRRACSVKLSNALKAAQSFSPWFIVLYVAPKGSRELAIYAKHIWRSEIEQALRAIRQCEKEGKQLHKKLLSITFDDADRKSEDELIKWMETCVETVPADYHQQKKTIFETVGFENGHAIGRVTFNFDSKETLYENFLGWGADSMAVRLR